MKYIIEIEKLTKSFGKVIAVNEVDLKVIRPEIFGIIGPSGCGKTTLLRSIAGLERPEKGRILIDGEVVFDADKHVFVPPEKRNIGMVFQVFAIWPHMTVFKNVAYPLIIKNLPKQEIDKRVKSVLELVGLKGFEDRYPDQLSGGQQQRVSLARALVMNPKIILFDEPMSNLDAKLAERLKIDIKILLKELNISAIYVTHDQAEAFTVADRIAVMKDGKIIQIGTPSELYEKPVNSFVAEFVGVSNKIKGKVSNILSDKYIQVITDIGDIICRKPSTNIQINDDVVIFVRVNDIELHPIGQEKNKTNMFKAKVKAKSFIGENTIYILTVNNSNIRVHAKLNIEEGKEILFSIDPSQTIVFKEGE